MSLTTRSIRPRSHVTLTRTRLSFSSVRRSFQILFVLAVPALSGCTDRVTDPPSSLTLSSSSARALRSFPTELATVGWQAQGRSLVASHIAVSPIAAARIYGLLGVAQYGAVVDADKQLDADGILNGDAFGDGGRRRFEAERGAIAGASARILSYLFPDAAVALEQRLSDEGKAGPGGVHPYFTRGRDIGRAFGDVMIAWAQNDGLSDPWTGTIPVGAGFWTRNPGSPLPPIAGPQFGAMTPYFPTSQDEFDVPTPPAFGSPAFLADLAAVSAISAALRTAAQLDTAVFWNLPPGTVSALGYWDALASQYIGERNFDERAAAHVFALTNAAGMDAIIGCWQVKFSSFYIRPYQVDQTQYPITTPIGQPNHPSYPSGHSCVSAAAATVIKSFFPEHAATLDTQVAAAGRSRVLGGIHYQFDITAGQNLGRAVAEAAIAYDRETGLLAGVR
jgi:membrane-associated phospholipid phosphatase